MKGRKRKNPSTTCVGVSSRTRARKAVSAGNEPARETPVVSLSVDSESDDMSAVSSKARQPPQPLELYFKSTEFTKTCKIQTKCFAKLGDMDVRMSKFEKNQRQLRRRAKKIEEKLTSIESNKNEERNYGEDMDFGWDDRDYGRAEGKENSEKAKEDKENSESGEEKDVVSGGENSKDGEKENNEKGEEEKDQEPEKDKENSDSVEKSEEYVEESDGESSLLRLQERVRVQAEEFWRTIDDESEAEEEVEKEGEEEAEEEVQEEKEGEKEAEKEGEKEAEKEVQEEKEAEKVESKGTPTSTGVIVITPRGRTKAAAARKAISISPEIVVVTGIAELAEKEVEVEATQKEQEAIQTEIVEKEAEVTEKDAELAEKEDQDVDEEEEKAEESEDNHVESPSEKHAELAEKSEIKDNLVESPAKKQTELAEKSVEVIAVPYGIPRAERLAKMRAEAEKKKARAEKKKAKADGAPKKKGRPKKTEATLKPCTPLLEKRKSEPSRWVQSPFTEGKTDELEVPKKKLKTKT
ncbi:unnamed protein product [Brassica oleracea]